MINPHIKNKRTGVHLDIQNRSSHYMRLIETKHCVDNSWTKGELKPIPNSRNLMRRSLQLHHREQNSRLMSKVSSIERKSYRTRTQVREKQPNSLKNKYKQYQKELSIADDNIKMLKRMGQIESQLSKRKMKEFNRQRTKYGKLSRHPSKNIELIDQLFYRQYKKQMVQSRNESKTQKAQNKSNQRKLHRQLKAISPHQQLTELVKQQKQKNI